MWLHEQGGWHSEAIADAFAEYEGIVVDALSDQVQYWMTINEPACFIGNGYVTGIHAPFEKTRDKPLPELFGNLAVLTRNCLLAHGKAVQVIRARAKTPPKIGMALNGPVYLPASQTPEAVEAARTQTFPAQPLFQHFSWWGDPMVLFQAPTGLEQVLSENDLAQIRQPLDFFGFNCYNANNYDEYTGPNPAVYPGMPRTAMGWPATRTPIPPTWPWGAP